MPNVTSCDSCGGRIKRQSDITLSVIFTGVAGDGSAAANEQTVVPIDWDGQTQLEPPFQPSTTVDLELCDDCKAAAFAEVSSWAGGKLKSRTTAR